MAAVAISPQDSVCSLRAAINNELHPDLVPGVGDATGSTFLFCYADGVPIDRGQEERLYVRDITIQSSGSDTVDIDSPWNSKGHPTEMCVFVHKEREAVEEAGAQRVLHRWENLQGGSFESEVSESS